ncbi:unnamed protein product [Allacma fusca]|uniref:Uncharacterized protein n=1 Tax=Allacma fusca TaxID=39272 RepID=A0A8J2JXX1_9HEXA|nr:unnamed protein product [Allacma fusca]
MGFASIFGQCLAQTPVKENDLTELRGGIHYTFSHWIKFVDLINHTKPFYKFLVSQKTKYGVATVQR